MKATLYYAAGEPEVLTYTDVADPEPGPADVIIKVAATALNRLDIVQRAGWFQLPGFTYPHIPGMDIAGSVVAVGEGVTEWQNGDRVIVDPSLVGVSDQSKLAGSDNLHGEHGIIGATRDGGYAELCLVPASHCLSIPDHVSFESAATFPTCWVTASHALYPIGNLQAGETVMIHAAGSGVSVAAIQLAKDSGAVVLATAGTDAKCERAVELGANHVFNNRTGDLAAWVRSVTGGLGVDMVLAHVGAALFGPSLTALAVKGRLVTCGNTSGDEATIRSLGFLYRSQISILGSGAHEPGEIATVWERFCGGGLSGVVDAEFDLSEAGAAHMHMHDNNFFGKILLRP